MYLVLPDDPEATIENYRTLFRGLLILKQAMKCTESVKG